MTKTKPKSQWGGARKGAGRPVANTKRVTYKLTQDEHQQLTALGGARWIRRQLAAEKAKGETK